MADIHILLLVIFILFVSSFKVAKKKRCLYHDVNNISGNKADEENYRYVFLSILLEFGLYCPDVQIGAYNIPWQPKR